MFKLLFKNLKAKNWVSILVIFGLTLLEVFFMMQIVGYISKLTGAVQASRENGVDKVWSYGFYMIICAILMAAVALAMKRIMISAAAMRMAHRII